MVKNILVIDNDIDLEEILKQILASESFELNFYEEVDNIVNIVLDLNPSIILLDYNLNGDNGGKLCQQLKADERTKSIPVILFSAFPKLIYALENYGFDAFIEKPFDVDEFLLTVRTLVKLADSQKNI